MSFKYGEDGANPFKDLQQPSHSTSNAKLRAYFSDKSNVEKKTEILKKLLSQPIVPDGPSTPLSEEEAEVVEEIRQAAATKAKQVKETIDKAEKRIDDLLSEQNPNFSVDLSRKPRVRRAVKDVFGGSGGGIGIFNFGGGGSKPTTITYEMYKEALRMRNEFNEEESEDVFQR